MGTTLPSQAFERDGFLVFDPGLDADLVEAALAHTTGLYLNEGDPPDSSGERVVYRDARRLQDAWRISAAVKEIATAPVVLDTLRALYGRTPLPFQTLNFRVGSEQKPHSDTIHFNAMPSGFMCGVWVALEDIDLDNGPVVYFPGSHRLPELTMADVLGAAGEGPGLARHWLDRLGRRSRLPPADPGDYLLYEERTAEVIRASGIEPRYATIRKGQAFLWSANLIHGGSPQTDRGRTRHSQVTHYFFEGCRWYTPLHSRGRQIAWRQPTWIV
jgi:ectoine hydroxylase-related dioxygenase (phytanoyl-CoA dioxygenase family)